jgi:3-hydroxyisobutyrate dehydrogenase
MTEMAPKAITPRTSRIGFIGIGNMGESMAANLVAAGWQVQVYDVDPAKGEKFMTEYGGQRASNLEELGRMCDVVITMVPDGKIVRRVLLGEGGAGDRVLAKAARGTLIIDMSSSSPVGTRELGSELEALGIRFLDAPVSGGVRGAAAGKLAIMIGGCRALAAECDDLLAPMGKRFYIGSLGSGHAMKVLNNYVSAAGLIAAGEAVLIGGRFGIDSKVMIDVINASSGRNNSTENKFTQFILNEKFNSGFSMGLMAKDLALAMEVAQACKVPAELGHATLDLWKSAEASIGWKGDHTEVVKHLGAVSG